jgi:hypothetical protein
VEKARLQLSRAECFGEGQGVQPAKPTSGRAAAAAAREREGQQQQGGGASLQGGGEGGMQQWQQQWGGLLGAVAGSLLRFEQLKGLVRGVLRLLRDVGSRRDLSAAEREQLWAVMVYMGCAPQNTQVGG